ncbi:HAD hydrolase-like protein [Streptomyces sp. BE20]|uniref:HAD family hydrolase n=1 Tax=Streptomyces sp. BE20 TaxID=3002525 RepID=UPI002E772600|nr:HAD family hydrolase [Streptomyces sp. BE20]MEE1823883.1 HAD hydrolase-like protein [Streptomyces sp. BE20]
MTAGTVLWDFDGTLGHRRHGTWAECLLEILDRQQPDHSWQFTDLFDALGTGFPWHNSDQPHPHLADADRWWAHITTVIRDALTRLGMDPEMAAAAAHATRATYIDTRAWSLYPIALHTLDHLRAEGWQHVVVSNHVPELPAILDALGVTPRLTAVINSAATGYEKPHLEAFRRARAAAGPGLLWMVGDNPYADVAGAQAAGINAIWVQRPYTGGIPDLSAAARVVLEHHGETHAVRWEIPPARAEISHATNPVG